MEIVFWVIYWLMAAAIIILLIKRVDYVDKIKSLENNNDYRFKQYLEEKKENDENKKIIENIKENLPF